MPECFKPARALRTASRYNARFAAIILFSTLTCGSARADLIDDLFGKDDGDWKEITTQLPSAPKPENLVDFFVIRHSEFTYALDTDSLSIGSDGVVRYTVVSVSDAGARNVSYEGVRCLKMEYRRYAFLHADGSWGRAQNEAWTPIVETAKNRQQFELAHEILCDDKRAPKTVNDILFKLKGRKPRFEY